MTIPTKPKMIQYCETCHQKIRLDLVTDYVRMKPTFDWEDPRYYCDKECLFQTPHRDIPRRQKIRKENE